MPLSSPRLACVYVPDFRLQAVLRDLGGEPEGGLALVDPEDGRRRIVAASAVARLDGVRRGMASTTATAMAPELCVREIDVSALAVVHLELEAAIRSITPRLETTGQGVLYAAYQGLERRYPEDGEAGFLDDLRQQVLRLGLPVRVGLACSRFAARVAAVMEGCRFELCGVVRASGSQGGAGPAEDGGVLLDPAMGIRVLPGREQAFLASMPLELLPEALHEIGVLRRLGLRSMGDFAVLAPGAVARRMGPRGLVLHRLVRGLDRCTLIPAAEPQSFHVECRVDEPIVQVEALCFLLCRPLQQLLSQLTARGLAARRLAWSLALEGEEEPIHGTTSAASPTASQSLWTRLIKLDLDRTSLHAGIVAVRLEARDIGEGPEEQQRLTGPRSAPPGSLSITQAHLAAELGENGYGLLEAQVHCWPEQRTSLLPGVVPGASAASRGCRSPGSSPNRALPPALPPTTTSPGLIPGFRRITPPEPIEVEVQNGGRPLGFLFRGRRRSVEHCFGPWDLSSGWWDRELRRRYFQLQGEGTIAQVYYAPGPRCWFLDGWVD